MTKMTVDLICKIWSPITIQTKAIAEHVRVVGRGNMKIPLVMFAREEVSNGGKKSLFSRVLAKE